MILKLKIIEGERSGEEFSIKGEATIGRSTGQSDLALNDPKVSGRHAKLGNDEKGGFFIEDLGSSNGILLNGVKVNQGGLKIGDAFQIGRTVFEVTDITGESLFEDGSWQATVDGALNQAQLLFEKIQGPKTPFGYFNKPIQLEIVKGDEVGKSFVFSFGPRRIGQYSPDAPVLAKNFPGLAFELRPLEGQCELFTKQKGLTVNSSVVSNQILKDGDLISIGQTEFLVKFVDPS